jgi:dienelactone hydrolase
MIRRIQSGLDRIRALTRLLKAQAAGMVAAAVDRLEPGEQRHKLIQRSMLVGLVLLGGWIGAESLNLPWGLVANIGMGIVIALLMLAISELIAGPGLGLLNLLKRLWTPAGLACVFAIIALFLLIGQQPLLALAAGLAGGLSLVVVAGGISLWVAGPRRRIAGTLCLVSGLIVILSGLVWVLGEERGEDPVADLIAVPDHPGTAWRDFLETGPYRTAYLTYGSGNDRWRGEYAEQASWTTDSVDARDLLGRPSGFGLRMRDRWWGFGLDALPLNGRVWYPVDAEGSLPLVLIVHGNHDMMHYSDPGYAWLGEHLASRGHVVVSVDQNFINGGMFGGVPRENGVRGWLLLEHLAQWRDWQDEPLHDLHEQVDLDQVILIGHSRGGEAAALAAVFNQLHRYPEDARVTFDYGFGIQGVAAIAPIDGQFWTSNKPTELHDVSYFVIHGGMDADVFYFAGDRQLLRTRPDPEQGRFSASLYVHHANHGQFNTVWGDNDTGMIAGRLLNRAWLLDGEQQRQVGKLYLTAFTEQALARPGAIPALFCDPGHAGRLLPETLYVARCDDGQRVVLADFENGVDIFRGNLEGIRLSGIDLDLWAERDVGFRGNPQRRQTGVFLGWQAVDDSTDSGSNPAYRIDLDETVLEQIRPGDHGVLWLDLAHADRDPPDSDEDRQEEQKENGEPSASEDESPLRPRLQLTIEISDTDGNRASRPLTDFGELLPPLPVRHTRIDMINSKRYGSPTEPLLQSMAVPLQVFAAEGVDLERMASIELQFDSATPGVLVIERISLEPGLQ